MKKLYNGKGKRIHPSLPPSSPSINFVAALPAALLTLAAALSPEEKEVLAYLLSPEEKKPLQLLHYQRKSHQPALGCGCFCCYKSFWAVWNASPNNHLIHRIIDAVESLESRKIQSCRRRRGRRGGGRKDSGEISPSALSAEVEVSNQDDEDGDDEGYEENVGEVDEEGDGKSSVRRFVSFIGERVWGVWNC